MGPLGGSGTLDGIEAVFAEKVVPSEDPKLFRGVGV